jgi:hypothetical protein
MTEGAQKADQEPKEMPNPVWIAFYFNTVDLSCI